jgi:hypothetical protein
MSAMAAASNIISQKKSVAKMAKISASAAA